MWSADRRTSTSRGDSFQLTAYFQHNQAGQYETADEHSRAEGREQAKHSVHARVLLTFNRHVNVTRVLYGSCQNTENGPNLSACTGEAAARIVEHDACIRGRAVRYRGRQLVREHQRVGSCNPNKPTKVSLSTTRILQSQALTEERKGVRPRRHIGVLTANEADT